MMRRMRAVKAFYVAVRILCLLAVAQMASAGAMSMEPNRGGVDLQLNGADPQSFTVQDVSQALAGAYNEYRKLFGLTQPVTVHMLSSADYAKVCPLFMTNCERTGGFAVNGTIYLNYDKATTWLARHELFHVVWTTIDPRYRWLSEGLATWFEDAPDYGWFDGMSPAAVAARTSALRPVGVNVYDWQQGSSLLTSYYEQADLRVEFLANKYGREKIFDLVTRLRSGMDVPTAFEKTFGFSIDRLDQVMRDEARLQA